MLLFRCKKHNIFCFVSVLVKKLMSTSVVKPRHRQRQQQQSTKPQSALTWVLGLRQMILQQRGNFVRGRIVVFCYSLLLSGFDSLRREGNLIRDKMGVRRLLYCRRSRMAQCILIAAGHKRSFPIRACNRISLPFL